MWLFTLRSSRIGSCPERLRAALRGLLTKAFESARGSLVWFRFFPRYQPERFVWIEMEVVSRRRGDGLASFERRDSLPDLVLAGLLHRLHGGGFGSNWHRDPRVGPNSPGRIPVPSRSGSQEIVERAYRNLKLTFFREYLHDLPVRSPAAAQPVYQFAVRLQAGARRFLG